MKNVWELIKKHVRPREINNLREDSQTLNQTHNRRSKEDQRPIDNRNNNLNQD
jgi:hypothetical protein